MKSIFKYSIIALILMLTGNVFSQTIIDGNNYIRFNNPGKEYHNYILFKNQKLVVAPDQKNSKNVVIFVTNDYSDKSPSLRPIILDYRIWNGGYGSANAFINYLVGILDTEGSINISQIGVSETFYNSESLSFYELEDDTFNILPSDKVIKISLLPASGDSVYVRGRVKVIDGKTSEEVLFLDDIAITLGLLLAPIDTLRFRNRGVVKYIVEW